jgi:hypothetical protein
MSLRLSLEATRVWGLKLLVYEALSYLIYSACRSGCRCPFGSWIWMDQALSMPMSSGGLFFPFFPPLFFSCLFMWMDQALSMPTSSGGLFFSPSFFFPAYSCGWIRHCRCERAQVGSFYFLSLFFLSISFMCGSGTINANEALLRLSY